MRYFAKRHRTDGETGEFCWNLPGGGVAYPDGPPYHPPGRRTQSSRVSGTLRQIEGLEFVEAALPAVAERQGPLSSRMLLASCYGHLGRAEDARITWAELLKGQSGLLVEPARARVAVR
jgi:hypothetical protein